MKMKNQKVRLATKMWMVPGKHQTVEELVEKYRDRVLSVEEDRILIVDVVEELDGL